MNYLDAGDEVRIDHIGYAVKDIERAREKFESLGFIFEETVNDKKRNLYIQFGIKDGYRIELVSPMTCSSPVDGILKAVGATPYHFCFKSSDMKSDIKRLERERYKVILPEAEAIAFGGRRVVFMMNREIGMLEIVEEAIE